MLVLAPLGQWKQPSHTWSPLAAAGSWNGALETAERMASRRNDTGWVKGGSFWSQAAEQRLAPLLYAAAPTGRGMGEVVRWVYGQGGAELDRLPDGGALRPWHRHHRATLLEGQNTLYLIPDSRRPKLLRPI